MNQQTKPTHLIQTGFNRVFGWTKILAKRRDMVPAIFDQENNQFVPIAVPVQVVPSAVPAPPKPNPAVNAKKMPPPDAPTIVEPGTLAPVQAVAPPEQPATLDPIATVQADGPVPIAQDPLQELKKAEIIDLAGEKFQAGITGKSKNDLITAYRRAEQDYLLAHPEAKTEGV